MNNIEFKLLKKKIARAEALAAKIRTIESSLPYIENGCMEFRANVVGEWICFDTIDNEERRLAAVALMRSFLESLRNELAQL